MYVICIYIHFKIDRQTKHKKINEGDFAKTPEIQSYIKSFVDKFAIAPLLRLNTKVESVTQGLGGKGWNVSVSSPSGAETLTFDYVVICQVCSQIFVSGVRWAVLVCRLMNV